MSKKVEFHSFLVENDVVIGHYLLRYNGEEWVDGQLWLDNEPPERAVSIMGGSLVLGSVMIEEAHIQSECNEIPGVLFRLPRPDSPVWERVPVSEGPEEVETS